MKKLIRLLLTVLATSSAMALSIDQVNCKGGNGYALTLTREKDTLRGSLQDAYNGAEIVCQQFGWGPQTFQRDILCVGVWNSAYDSNGQAVDRVVQIHMSLEREAPMAFGLANYMRNWDERNPASIVPKSLKCALEFK
jgi:hypothetical protein